MRALQASQRVFCSFCPAVELAPKSVQPVTGRFKNSAPGKLRLLPDRVCFVAVAADLRAHAQSGKQLTHLLNLSPSSGKVPATPLPPDSAAPSCWKRRGPEQQEQIFVPCRHCLVIGVQQQKNSMNRHPFLLAEDGGKPAQVA